MTRLCYEGFEFGRSGPWAAASVLGFAFPNTPTWDTATVRTGTYSLKCTNAAQAATSTVTTATASTTYYLRMYVNFAVFPTGTTIVMSLFSTSGSTIDVRCTSGGALQLTRGAGPTQIGSDSAALSTGTWYRVELSATLDGSGSNVTAAELRIDGTTTASGSGFTQARGGSGLGVGWVSSPTTGTLYLDDVALNNSAGAANNTWPGSGKIILMMPVSDNARGAWVAGAGGTTNLFDAVNNLPPVGVADASGTNTSQIKNQTTTNPTSCDLNLDTYANAGLGASDTINAIIIGDADGEDPSTGTKTGACSMVSNPAIAEPTAFNFGDDAGAQGTYLGNWKGHQGTLSEAPSVTISSAPVIRIRCISGATAARAASCCFLGAFIDYTPAAVARVPRSPGVDSGYGHL